ncbi:MAG: helix-turn-helix transcriptional regulator [Betaproteobacteria bacterium]|nr:helix-turn-helix transcriptional regulator [Betaproteobacteria bacterium]
MNAGQKTHPETMRIVTPQEFSHVVQILREMRKWSQETLSAISGLSVRTVQRVENGEPSSVDTRRALARAFESEDIDVFNKPCDVPTKEHLLAEKEKFERDHVTVACNLVKSGRDLMAAFTTAMADQSMPATPMNDAAEETFATLLDYLRDWRDCWDLTSEVDKLEVYREIQNLLDSLFAANISVVIATRDVKLMSPSWPDKTPWPVTVLHMAAFEKGAEPKEIWVRRQVKFG